MAALRDPAVPLPTTTRQRAATVKDALMATFERLGGVEAMARWASENQTDFYKLYAKLLPVQANINVDVNHFEVLQQRRARIALAIDNTEEL